MEYVRTAETPTGERYRVVAAPPGSALDAGDGRGGGGVPGALLGVVMLLIRSGRRGWRIAITPCDGRGRPTGATHRERVAHEGAADARVEAILRQIRDGEWP